MEWITILLIILIIVFFYAYIRTPVTNEGFDESSGRFCPTCSGKTLNQCTRCFNCGWCVDKFGNSACLGGDSHGPFNFEKCNQWYYVDNYAKAIQNNERYRCSDGPMSSNRILGV